MSFSLPLDAKDGCRRALQLPAVARCFGCDSLAGGRGTLTAAAGLGPDCGARRGGLPVSGTACQGGTVTDDSETKGDGGLLARPARDVVDPWQISVTRIWAPP